MHTFRTLVAAALGLSLVAACSDAVSAPTEPKVLRTMVTEDGAKLEVLEGNIVRDAAGRTLKLTGTQATMMTQHLQNVAYAEKVDQMLEDDGFEPPKDRSGSEFHIAQEGGTGYDDVSRCRDISEAMYYANEEYKERLAKWEDVHAQWIIDMIIDLFTGNAPGVSDGMAVSNAWTGVDVSKGALTFIQVMFVSYDCFTRK